MQLDFHYYATYCAAILAGWSHAESLEICTAAQYVDCCTRTVLKRMKAPLSAATTQSQMEMMDLAPGILTLQDVTRIWASFHFLPGDLYADPGRRTKLYLDKYRLICRPNSDLLVETVDLAAQNGSLQAMGIAMHILADTWAHRNFAGSPSMVINNVGPDFMESRMENGKEVWTKVIFRHSVAGADDLEGGHYTSSLPQYNEQSVMNLGHGRVGHLPDYSFIKYRYLPAWGDYAQVIKDNPSDYLHAFAQMVYALGVLRTGGSRFQKDTYAWDTIAPVREQIEALLRVRRPDAAADWKALGEALSGEAVPDFSEPGYEEEYLSARDKDSTAPGRFILAALAHKSMVTRRIFESRNLLAGISVDYAASGIRGIRDFHILAKNLKGRRKK